MSVLTAYNEEQHPDSPRPFGASGLRGRVAPFAFAVAIAMVFAWLSDGADRDRLLVTGGFFVFVALVIVAVPWRRLPRWVEVAPPILGLVLLGSISLATGGLSGPFFMLDAIPLFYIGLFGLPRDVAAVLVALIGEELYVASQTGGDAITGGEVQVVIARLVMLGAVGFTTSVLMRRLRVSNQQLEVANGLLDFRMHALAHDLKNSLQGVLGYARLAEVAAGNDDTETARRLVSRISESSLRMQVLINDIMEMSRARRSEEHTAFSPLAVIAEAAADAQGVTLEVGELPPRVRAHRASIYRAFKNLFENAAKYARLHPERAPVVRVWAVREGDMWCFHVEDDGPGIGTDDVERLFRAFERGSRAVGTDGHGLGLAVVSACAEAHGGSVAVENGARGGARFTVRIRADHDLIAS